ncbi:ABC transporter related [Gloeothece citriformis PCC 7424]|uniref:ABC transporter related n=2 Tax=Gloeothece TaxID=28070 RepID=B7KJC0_GLOC7|nr:ABC transporter related [Gloeothece citriformis PCC 7424]
MEFEQVEYTYPCCHKPALNSLTLQIGEFQRYGIIGRNGCGKTTLFRLANGLYRPQRGIIRWQGMPLSYHNRALNQLRQQVGLVFQDPEQQLVGATVEEDLSYGLCNLGLPKGEIAHRVQQALLDFDLTDLGDTPVNYLSLGQKKRLSLADVMILQPKLLLLDEPTAYLDPYQTRHLVVTLEQIRAKGTTILIATHDLDFVYAWADWLFVLEGGQLRLEGSPESVFSQRKLMEALGLGIPLSLDLLTAFSEESFFSQSRQVNSEEKITLTGEEFRQWILRRWQKN